MDSSSSGKERENTPNDHAIRNATQQDGPDTVGSTLNSGNSHQFSQERRAKGLCTLPRRRLNPASLLTVSDSLPTESWAEGRRASCNGAVPLAQSSGPRETRQRKQPRLDSKAPAPCIRPCRKSKSRRGQAPKLQPPTCHAARRISYGVDTPPLSKGRKPRRPRIRFTKSTEYTSLIIHPKTKKKKNKTSPTKLYTRTANPVATRHHGWTRYQTRRRN